MDAEKVKSLLKELLNSNSEEEINLGIRIYSEYLYSKYKYYIDLVEKEREYGIESSFDANLKNVEKEFYFLNYLKLHKRIDRKKLKSLLECFSCTHNFLIKLNEILYPPITNKGIGYEKVKSLKVAMKTYDVFTLKSCL